MDELCRDASLCPRITRVVNIQDFGAVPPCEDARKLYIELASIELDRRVRSLSPSPFGVRKRNASETSLESMASMASCKTHRTDATSHSAESEGVDRNVAVGAMLMLGLNRTERPPSC